MEEFVVAIGRALTPDEVAALEAAGIPLADIPTVSAGYSGTYDVTLTYVRFSAATEAEARSKVAAVIGYDADELRARPSTNQ